MPTRTPNDFDAMSDAVDEGEPLHHAYQTSDADSETHGVNVLKGKGWSDTSAFDAEKDKTQFRQYEDACERVKNFYKEQHGMLHRWPSPPLSPSVLSSSKSVSLSSVPLALPADTMRLWVQKNKRWSSISRCVLTCAKPRAHVWVRHCYL